MAVIFSQPVQAAQRTDPRDRLDRLGEVTASGHAPVVAWRPPTLNGAPT
jgi:hypothetical protein